MSRIIKNNSPIQGRAVGRSAALNIANFAEQAQRMIIEAQAQATQVATQAHAAAREIHTQADQRGFAEGFQRGLADGQADGAERSFAESKKNFDKQTAELQKMLKQTVLQLEQAHQEILHEARTELLDLALAIAEKITHVQARGDIEVAKASLGKAIEMVNCAGQVQARVCASQLDQLREYAAGFLGSMEMSDLVKFVPDASLVPGDVVLASRNGEVDARIQTQIDNVVAALTGQEKSAR